MDEFQTSATVLLVRPASFGFHPDAAESNAFARPGGDVRLARREFEGLVQALDLAGVRTLVLDDDRDPPKPDAVFPNNWVSFHADGIVVLYPMANSARRLERNLRDVQALVESAGYRVQRVLDLSAAEEDGRFLEGTGSLVFDRPRRLAFASRSLRTDERVAADCAAALGYSLRMFDAFDRSGKAIYHTNVLLSLGAKFAVLCPDVIPEDQRPGLIAALESSDRELITVSYAQMCSFACNIIELKNTKEEPVIAMSDSARRAFDPSQRQHLERFGTIVPAEIPTIEAVGGGSVRCMIADVHLPRL